VGKHTTFAVTTATARSTASTRKSKEVKGKMKANYLQKTIESLKPSEKKAIDKMYFDRWDKELVIAQFNWIRMAICVMANNPKFTTEDMLCWLGAFKRMYQLNSRFTTQEQLDEYLKNRMDEVFGEGGFPDDFMRDFEKIGRS
jgi:Cdc6-like AAA superfamily ATPase